MTQKLDDEPAPEGSPPLQSTEELSPEHSNDLSPPAQEDNLEVVGAQDAADSYPTTRSDTEAEEPSHLALSQPDEDVPPPSGEPENW